MSICRVSCCWWSGNLILPYAFGSNESHFFFKLLYFRRNETNGQEIYMYDIGTQLVNRLKGELSSAFVDVAESNAKAQDDDDSDEILMSLSDSGIYEKMPTMVSSDGERVSVIEAKSATHALNRHQPIVVQENDDQQPQSSTINEQRISISSGYSVIKR